MRELAKTIAGLGAGALAIAGWYFGDDGFATFCVVIFVLWVFSL